MNAVQGVKIGLHRRVRDLPLQLGVIEADRLDSSRSRVAYDKRVEEHLADGVFHVTVWLGGDLANLLARCQVDLHEAGLVTAQRIDDIDAFSPGGESCD